MATRDPMYKLGEYAPEGPYSDTCEPIQVVRPRYAYTDAEDTTRRGERASLRLVGGNVDALLKKYTGHQIMQDIISQMSDTTAGGGLTSFMLQRMDISYSEKVDVKQLMGDAEVSYYFGRAPLIFQMSGLLFDDGNNQWFFKFGLAYSELLRGSKLAENQQLLQVNLPSCTVYGTVNSLSVTQDSARDTDIPFSMSILVKRIVYREMAEGLKPTVISQMMNDAKNSESLGNLTGLTMSSEDINTLKKKVRAADKFNLTAVGSTYGNFFASSDIADDKLGNILSQLKSFNLSINDILSGIVGTVSGYIGIVTNITNEATAIVREVENTVDSVLGAAESIEGQILGTAKLIENTVGVITSIPESIAERVSRFLQHGIIGGTSAILDADVTGLGPSDVSAILLSRETRTVSSSGNITSGANRDSIELSSAIDASTADQVATI